MVGRPTSTARRRKLVRVGWAVASGMCSPVREAYHSWTSHLPWPGWHTSEKPTGAPAWMGVAWVAPYHSSSAALQSHTALGRKSQDPRMPEKPLPLLEAAGHALMAQLAALLFERFATNSPSGT